MVVIVSIAILFLLSWVYILSIAKGMNSGMFHAMSPSMESWSVAHLFMTFVMWVVMMAAMMIPSAAPMILTFATIIAGQPDPSGSFGPTGVFTLGYLAAWTMFSAAATAAQYGLSEASLLSPLMAANDTRVGGVILITAGLYQWTPLKRACLNNCRSPIGFLMTEWRDGIAGAFKMGMRHGSFCVGCCWALMLILFVTGVMNLVWVAGLAVIVLLEKVLTAGKLISHVSGAVLMAAGVWLLAA